MEHTPFVEDPKPERRTKLPYGITYREMREAREQAYAETRRKKRKKERAKIKREQTRIKNLLKKDRMKRIIAKRKAKQDEKEYRVYMRWLLFCKGRGKDKNLNQKDSLTINRHVHETYDKYLLALEQGIDTRIQRNRIRLKVAPSFKTYRRCWYGRSKACYKMFDVPKLMEMKWKELQRASGNTEVPEQFTGEWMQVLRREISERERRDMDLQVHDVSPVVRGDEGQREEPQQLRERIEETRGRDRESQAVGK